MKNVTRIITLVNAAHEDVDQYRLAPNDFDPVEYFDDVLLALAEALDLLDPKEELK